MLVTHTVISQLSGIPKMAAECSAHLVSHLCRGQAQLSHPAEVLTLGLDTELPVMAHALVFIRD